MMDGSAFDNWVNRYAREVHDEYDINVPLSDVEIKTTSRMTKALGRAMVKSDGEDRFHVLKISYPQYKTYGKSRMKECIRHEWAHIIQQYVVRLCGHGNTFQYLSERLEFPSERYENNHNAKWRMECENCGLLLSKTRDCKRIQQGRDGNVRCARCNSYTWNVEKVNHTRVMRKLREEAFGSKEEDSYSDETEDWKKDALNNLKA